MAGEREARCKRDPVTSFRRIAEPSLRESRVEAEREPFDRGDLHLQIYPRTPGSPALLGRSFIADIDELALQIEHPDGGRCGECSLESYEAPAELCSECAWKHPPALIRDDNARIVRMESIAGVDK